MTCDVLIRETVGQPCFITHSKSMSKKGKIAASKKASAKKGSVKPSIPKSSLPIQPSNPPTSLSKPPIKHSKPSRLSNLKSRLQLLWVRFQASLYSPLPMELYGKSRCISQITPCLCFFTTLLSRLSMFLWDKLPQKQKSL